MKLGYLTNQYPKISHAFIRREILALEAQGVEITRFSIRRSPDAFVDPSDKAEPARTEFLLARGAPALFASVMRAAAQPRAFAHAYRVMWRMGAGSQRGMARHFAYLAEACLLRELCAARGIAHIHVHHATNPAAVALLCKVIGGPTYSLTVHGPEEYQEAARLGLPEKIAHAAFVVTVSEWGRRQLLPWCGATAQDKIQVLPIGVEEIFSCTPPVRIPDAPHFLWVGRLEEQKDPLLMVRAVERLRAQNRTCTVTMLGDGHLRAEIEREIARRDLHTLVMLKGWAGRQEILAELRACRALVLSSRAENVPSVILEALAQERPVVTTRVGGTAELVRDGETGWLVRPNSIEALAGGMRCALETDAAKLEGMGQAGRRFVLENFDVSKWAAQLRKRLELVALPA